MRQIKQCMLMAVMLCVSVFQTALANEQGYKEIAGLEATSTPEVIEFFSFGCPHCYSLEPKLEAWVKEGKPAETAFRRIPVVFNPSWAVYSKAYFLTELLQKPELVAKIFARVHQAKQQFHNDDEIRAFFIANGVSAPQYDFVANSFELDNKMAEANQLQRKFKIMSVPSFVINGKYLTGGSEAGSYDKLFSVLTDLPLQKATAEAAEKK